MTSKRQKPAVRVGSARAVPGQISRGVLHLGDFPDAPIVSPVLIVSGKKSGPLLWVQGCIHGTEVGGSVGLAKFLNSVDPASLCGTIVGVMLANPTAFQNHSRNTPHDGENLNRVFPGSRNSGHSQQVAHTLATTARSVADAVLDLHSGGDRSNVPFYALYRDDGSDAAKAAERLARSAGTPDLWGSKDRWLEGAMFAHLTRLGIPSLIVECGGAAQVPDSHIDSFTCAIRGVAQALGIVSGKPPVQARYRQMDTAQLVHSTTGGLFVPSVEAGDTVEQGQELGRIVDLFGDVTETVRAPGAGWIAAIRRRYMPVYSGDMLAEVIHVVKDR